jgi:hypothetical protein
MNPRRHVLRIAATVVAIALTAGAIPARAQPVAPGGDDNLVGPSAAGAPAAGPFSVGSAATDTFGGYLPDEATLNAYDTANPVIGRLDPALLAAVQKATDAAAAQGVTVRINSGWRSAGFQQRLFDDAVQTYGSAELAAQFVASPQTSMHVQGRAVDVGGPDAAAWMAANGSRFGLCQIYANELWHYELTADAAGNCAPMRPNAAG